MTASRSLDLFLRLSLGALLLSMTVISASPSCDSSEVPASIDVSTGNTYGAEISLTVTGRGRVTSSPPSIDCPSDCFAKIVLPSGSVDGGDGGITLIAEDTPGAHFVGWSFAEVDLGARARGPAACSPMTRKASVPPGVDLESTVVSVPFGETAGTPPAGHEAECAAYRSVSLAYAVTAKFSEDPPQPGFDASVDPDDLDVLFLPTYPTAQANEIGVTGGYAYWRFTLGGLPNMSGVEGSDLASNSHDVIVAPDQSIRTFDVGRHVAFQTVDATLRVIMAGQMSTNLLGGAPICHALASDAQNVYCRAAFDGGTAIYAWPVTGLDVPAPSIVHVLPFGDDLAVDAQRFYFSDTGDAFDIHPTASVFSATHDADVDGGTPTFTTLATGQWQPSRIAVGPFYIAWIDAQHDGMYAATRALKAAQKVPGPPVVVLQGSWIPGIAVDPSTDDFWIGVDTTSIGGSGGSGAGGWRIHQAPAGSTTTTLFRSGTGDLGGIAVDETSVYWTLSNGRVYRAFKNGNGGEGAAPPPPGH